MHVVGVTRTPRAGEGFDEIMPTEQLKEAAGRADFLINILPATKDNLLLFDRALFAAMKPTAYYISAGRGQTVDEAALVDALRERPHRRRRARCFSDRAAAGRQPVLGFAECVHPAASRRLHQRIRRR